MKRILPLVTALALAAAGAHGDALAVNLTFTQPLVFANPGDLVVFDATAFAPTTNDGPVYLNADSYNIDGPLLLDDSPFLDFPQFLNPGNSFKATLFDVTVPAGSSGLYAGYFEIDGGACSDASICYDYLGSATFNVDVAQEGEVPEPSTFALLATAGAWLVLGRLRKPERR